MRLLNKIFILIFFVVLFSDCQQKKLNSDWYKDAIKFYISQTCDNMDDYTPLNFQVIDEIYLKKQPAIKNIMTELTGLYPKLFSVSENLFNIEDNKDHQMLIQGINALPKLELDTIPKYINISSKIDQLAENQDQLNNTFNIKTLKNIRYFIDQEVKTLNEILNTFNLSVYNTNILGKDSVIVYHRFKTMNKYGSLVIRESVFEISKDSHRIMVEKVLN